MVNRKFILVKRKEMDQIFLFLILFLKKFKKNDYRDIISTAYTFLYMTFLFPFFGALIFIDQVILNSNYTIIESDIKSRIYSRLIILPFVIITMFLFVKMVNKTKRVKYLHYLRKTNPFSKNKRIFLGITIITLISSLIWLPLVLIFLFG